MNVNCAYTSVTKWGKIASIRSITLHHWGYIRVRKIRSDQDWVVWDCLHGDSLYYQSHNAKPIKENTTQMKYKKRKIPLFSDLFNDESVRTVNLYLCNTISGHTAHFSSFPNPSVVRSTEHLCIPEHLLWLWLQGETLQRVVDSANIACKMATLWLNTIDLT